MTLKEKLVMVLLVLVPPLCYGLVLLLDRVLGWIH